MAVGLVMGLGLGLGLGLGQGNAPACKRLAVGVHRGGAPVYGCAVGTHVGEAGVVPLTAEVKGENASRLGG